MPAIRARSRCWKRRNEAGRGGSARPATWFSLAFPAGATTTAAGSRAAAAPDWSPTTANRRPSAGHVRHGTTDARIHGRGSNDRCRRPRGTHRRQVGCCWPNNRCRVARGGRMIGAALPGWIVGPGNGVFGNDPDRITGWPWLEGPCVIGVSGLRSTPGRSGRPGMICGRVWRAAGRLICRPRSGCPPPIVVPGLVPLPGVICTAPAWTGGVV